MAAHASTRTTQLYERREDRVTLDEMVKINIGHGVGSAPSVARSLPSIVGTCLFPAQTPRNSVK